MDGIVIEEIKKEILEFEGRKRWEDRRIIEEVRARGQT